MVFSLWTLSGAATAASCEARESFQTLYELYHAPVLRYLQQLSGSPEQAEELTQETFVKAYTGLLTFRGDCSPATWLFRIARNTYLNSRRQPAPGRIGTQELLQIPDSSTGGDPVRAYAAGEQREWIGMALRELPEQQRSILLLRDAAGLAYAEIAEVLGISIAAVRIKLFRARNAFRTIYRTFDKPYGDDDGEL
jgi:RNA polymerase sigma-70 factor (ECF subfamily)